MPENTNDWWGLDDIDAANLRAARQNAQALREATTDTVPNEIAAEAMETAWSGYGLASEDRDEEIAADMDDRET